MRRTVARLMFASAMTAIVIFGADNSLGTWKRNVEKTKTTPPPANPITSLTIVREAADGGVKSTSTGQYKDGTAVNSTYTAKYDGKENPVVGAPWDTIAIKQINANTFSVETKKTGGSFRSAGRMVVSKDGKTMTLTGKGTNAEGKSFTNKIVYEKQ